MRRKYIPQADAGWSLQPEGSQGDGVTMGVSVGGTINEGNAANAIWVPASAMTREDGSLAKFPSLAFDRHCPGSIMRSEEHTSELQSLMRISYAVFCLKKKRKHT